MNRQTMWTLELTAKNNLVSGFKCRHDEVTSIMIKDALKAAIEWLNRQAKAKQWHCILYAVVSETNPRTGARVAPHAHLVVYGSPCCTITRAIKGYWTSHGYGNSIQCSMQACATDGKISYMWIQARYQFFRLINYHVEQATTLFGCNEEAARYYLRPHGRKKNVMLAWLGYRNQEIIDQAENSSTHFFMIEDNKRACDTAYLQYLGQLKQ